MSVTPAAAARLAEQFDLITEIGRNITGAPPGAGPEPASPTAPAGAGAAPMDGEDLVGDRLAARQPRDAAHTLAGLRPPLAGQAGQQPPRAAMDSLVAALLTMRAHAAHGAADAAPRADAKAPPPPGLTTQPASAGSEMADAGAFVSRHGPSLPGAPAAAARGAAPSFPPAEARQADRAAFATQPGEKPDAPLSMPLQGSPAGERIARSLIAAHPLGAVLVGEAAAAGGPLPAERAGILASFVLNAHFLPGWPPLRPIESPQARSLLDGLAAQKKMDARQAELLAHLVRLGLDKRQLERTLRLVARTRQPSRLLGALAVFLTTLGETLRSLSAELEAATDELQARSPATAGTGRRARIDLR